MTISDMLDDRYDVTPDDVRALGGRWNADYAYWRFPDGSSGIFTDLCNGARERTLDGRPLFRFVAIG